MRCGYFWFDNHTCERCRNCPHAYRRRFIRRCRIKGKGREKKSERIIGRSWTMNDDDASRCPTSHFRAISSPPLHLTIARICLVLNYVCTHTLSLPCNLDSPFNRDFPISADVTLLHIDLHPPHSRFLFYSRFLSTVACNHINYHNRRVCNDDPRQDIFPCTLYIPIKSYIP